MPATVTVLYPAGADATFDLQYYLNTHMPLVWKHWADKGLKSYIITENKATADSTPPPFLMQAALQWDSIDAFKAAAETDDSKIVLGDIPNFTNTKPTILIGEAVQSK